MDRRANGLNKRTDDACAALAALIAAKTPPVAGAQARRGRSRRPRAPRCKPNDVLKPDKLTGTTVRSTTRCWRERFDVYYSSSVMSAASCQGATGLPIRVRGRKIWTKRSARTSSRHPDLQHPDGEGLHGDARGRIPRHPPDPGAKVNFLQECQKPKQASVAEFVAKLEAQGGEADLAGITPDGLFVLRIIAGILDDELRNKFLKEANPTKACS
jgi:hypothetical protein